jgi:hypothetical protein
MATENKEYMKEVPTASFLGCICVRKTVIFVSVKEHWNSKEAR